MSADKVREFSDHIASCEGIIGKICRLYGRSREDALDLKQDILLNAWGSYPQFRGEAKFSTWLYKVSLNTAIGRIRKKKVQEQPLTAMHDRFPEHAGEKADRYDLLNRLINHLNDQEKAIVALYLDELGYEEIAEITGMTQNHVGVKLNRIKQKLKTILHHEH